LVLAGQNTQIAREDVAAIEKAVGELLTGRWTDKDDATRPAAYAWQLYSFGIAAAAFVAVLAPCVCHNLW
jgi:hypothetical protein